MNRAAQLQAKIAKQQAKLDKERADLALAQGQLREEDRKAINRRRYYIGTLADTAGLLGWENAELEVLFETLGSLRDLGSPDAILKHLFLGEGVGQGEPGIGAPGASSAGREGVLREEGVLVGA